MDQEGKMDQLRTDNHLPIIYAHRGASGYAVDNTMTSFDLALEQGADGLESDVYCTTDGVAFLYHDSRLKLQKNNEILEMKPGDIHSRDLENVVLRDNEQVPTVDEFFEKYSFR